MTSHTARLIRKMSDAALAERVAAFDPANCDDAEMLAALEAEVDGRANHQRKNRGLLRQAG